MLGFAPPALTGFFFILGLLPATVESLPVAKLSFLNLNGLAFCSVSCSNSGASYKWSSSVPARSSLEGMVSGGFLGTNSTLSLQSSSSELPLSGGT